MLLAEELALLAIDPDSGRHQLGIRSDLNACLAGLLVAELLLDGSAVPGPKAKTIVPAGAALPEQPVLRAVAGIVADRGPKIRAILSHMDRGLDAEHGVGTGVSAVGGLVTAGVVGASRGGLRPPHELRRPEVRDELLGRLQAAAAADGPVERRTAVVLSMTGPAQLLEQVAPDRAGRRHARHRIDHVLEDTDLEPIGDIVRALRAEAASIAAVAATGAVVSSS
jgi:hypothetical protein